MPPELASSPCFLRGTRILTTYGEIPAEDLAPGHSAVTLSGGCRRILSVSRRTLDLRRHPWPAETWPVRIRRGALGNGVPTRDLLVSPNQALLIGRMLVPAHRLVNGATVLRDVAWLRLDCVQVTLEAHDVLLAEGAPAESHPARGEGAGPGAARVVALHPRFADTQPAATDCAPRALRGTALAEARRTLLVRARVLGHALTRTPDLHLLADGIRLNPSDTAGAAHCFALPDGAADLRIVSRAGIPAETEPASEDQRRLGVMLARIELRTAGETIEWPAGDPALCEGFHPPERVGGQLVRWTDGHARLPPLPPGVTRIDLHVVGAQPAWARAALPDAPMHRSA